uniref:Uncharacterized protein n=2 Tax=Cacopsylla melanoneura TaxID=428564 RepID=A0A8D8Z4G9_9HEMI
MMAKPVSNMPKLTRSNDLWNSKIRPNDVHTTTWKSIPATKTSTLFSRIKTKLPPIDPISDSIPIRGRRRQSIRIRFSSPCAVPALMVLDSIPHHHTTRMSISTLLVEKSGLKILDTATALKKINSILVNPTLVLKMLPGDMLSTKTSPLTASTVLRATTTGPAPQLNHHSKASNPTRVLQPIDIRAMKSSRTITTERFRVRTEKYHT